MRMIEKIMNYRFDEGGWPEYLAFGGVGRKPPLGDCRRRRYVGVAGWYSVPIRATGRDGRR